MALGSPHLSLYQLTLERGTPYGGPRNGGRASRLAYTYAHPRLERTVRAEPSLATPSELAEAMYHDTVEVCQLIKCLSVCLCDIVCVSLSVCLYVCIYAPPSLSLCLCVYMCDLCKREGARRRRLQATSSMSRPALAGPARGPCTTRPTGRGTTMWVCMGRAPNSHTHTHRLVSRLCVTAGGAGVGPGAHGRFRVAHADGSRERRIQA
jgi:hypothetical protein